MFAYSVEDPIRTDSTYKPTFTEAFPWLEISNDTTVASSGLQRVNRALRPTCTTNWPCPLIDTAFVSRTLRLAFFSFFFFPSFLDEITERYWRDSDFCKEPRAFCSPRCCSLSSPPPSPFRPVPHSLQTDTVDESSCVNISALQPARPNERVLYPPHPR